MQSIRRLVFLLIAACGAFAASAPGYTVAQLVAFMRSSVQQKLPDNDVAKYVSRMKLSEKLDASTVEQLGSEGIGPKTMAALKEQIAATASLTPPAPVVEAPKPPSIPPPPYEEQQKVIAEMTEYALNYAKRLPDFLCTQVTRRYADPRFRDSWINVDTVVAKVSYNEGHENYEIKLINNTTVENKTMEQLSGAVSTGEFGSILEHIFEPQTKADFHFERWGKLRGKLMYVFGYEVDQAHSDYSIEYDRKVRIVAAYKGLIYVDKDAHKIHRVTTEAVDIPVSFPVRSTNSIVDYDLTAIGSQSYMLPLRAEVHMRDSEVAIRNSIGFRSYRKFSAEAEIRFEDVGEEPDDSKTKEQPVAPEPPKK